MDESMQPINRKYKGFGTMRVASFFLAIAFFGAAHAGEIRYERIFPMIDGPDNRLVITITDDDEMIVERPGFMSNSGTHVFELDNEGRMKIEDGLSARTVSSAGLERRVQNRKSNELTHITDEEITVIRRYDANRKVVEEVWARGVQPRARQFGDDPDLKQLADLENDLWSMMDSRIAARDNPRDRRHDNRPTGSSI